MKSFKIYKLFQIAWFVLLVISIINNNVIAEGFDNISPYKTLGDENWDSRFIPSNAPNGTVNAIAVIGNDVYVGGGFSKIGNQDIKYLARWDGNNWYALNGELTGVVTSLLVVGNELYVGGHFTTAGGITVNRIAKYDGNSWSALGSGVNGAVNAIASIGSDIYVGGFFTSAGGNSNIKYIARWDGSNWNALGTSVNGNVRALAVSGTDLLVGGQFSTAGSISAGGIAKWAGNTWSRSGFFGTNGVVSAIHVNGNDQYIGGNFTNVGASPNPGVVNTKVAKWNGTQLTKLGAGNWDVQAYIYTITTMGSDVYIGGQFSNAAGVNAPFIAKWDGNNWSSLGSGTSLWVNTIYVNGTDIYVGGEFTSAGGKPSNYFGIYHTQLTDINIDYSDMPNSFKLNQNYPNPFNPSTKISWHSPVGSHTTLKIYDVLGNEVATLVDEYKEAGNYEVEFNVGQAISLSSGVYFYKLQTGNFVQTKKMMLLK